MVDIVDDFCDYAASLPSPLIFRQWAAIGMISGALERRVWTIIGHKLSYANLFIMLVAPPGVGKQCIEMVKDLWKATKKINGESYFFVGQDSYTKASMIDHMAKCQKTYIPDNAEPLVYHPLLVAAEEFPVLFPIFDPLMINNLSDLWNAKPEYEESRRTSDVKHVKFPGPFLTMLLGYQPGVMALTLPQQFWDQGFARRTIMVWSGQPILQSLFNPPNARPEFKGRLLKSLAAIGDTYGLVRWDDDASEYLERWHMAEGPPRPNHSRLQNYNNSRSQLLIKLSMVASASESLSLIVYKHHVLRAMDWLFEAEKLMPDIFRAMIGDSDVNMINELHAHLVLMFAKAGRKPIHQSVIWGFLSQRTPSTKIPYIVQTMEKSGLITREPGTETLWIPRAGRKMVE